MGRKVDRTAEGFLVRETVSEEENPVTPAFATEDELIDYLATHGDFWDQAGGSGPWTHGAAWIFVNRLKVLPSMMFIGGRLLKAKDIPLAIVAQEGGA